MASQGRENALDHVVMVVFENRSLDNVLGRLYGPEDGKTFDGVIGKDLTNPIPEWAEHGADRKVVPYAVATDMDSPNPDTGEEYPHTNTQLFNILSETNRFKLGEEISAPYNAPRPGRNPRWTALSPTTSARTDPSAPEGQFGFTFDRSGYRVPAIVVSPWVAEGQVFNEEYRHTSLIATLREQWALGDPLTARDAAARTFTRTLTLDTPRDPGTWPVPDPRPVPRYIQDALGLGQTISAIGAAVFEGIRAYAEQHNIQIEGLPADPEAEVPPDQALHIIHNFLAIQFPLLHPAVPSPAAAT